MEINFDEIYHFLFETFNGVIVLICVSLVVCIIACVIMEHRTKKMLRERKEARLRAEAEREALQENDDDEDED